MTHMAVFIPVLAAVIGVTLVVALICAAALLSGD